LPIKFKTTDNLSQNDILKYMLLFFPLVGIAISVISILFYSIFESSWYTALLSSILYMILYGFLHTEAIADVIDALYAVHGGKDGFKIIKEPTIGAMGLLYTVSFLFLKLSSLTLVFLNNLFLELIVISILSRLSILYIIFFNDFRSTFVNSLKSSICFKYTIIASIIYCLFAILLTQISFFLLAMLTILTSYLFIDYLKRNLHFLNGDTLGMNLELNELVMLIFFHLAI